MTTKKGLPAPTLIILKNSTRDVIPTPEELEIGEIALSLFPGKEAIWVKNGDGDVLDIRKPASNALWGDCFSEYPNRIIFDQELSEGKINEDKLYFIRDEKQIWARGEFYGSDYDPKEIDEILSKRLVSIPLDVLFLDPKASSSKSIEEAWGGVKNFKTIAIAVFNNKVVAWADTKHAEHIPDSISVSIPLTVTAELKDSDNIILRIDGILNNNIYHNETHFNNGVFGVQNFSEVDVVNVKRTLDKVNSRLDVVEDTLCWEDADVKDN